MATTPNAYPQVLGWSVQGQQTANTCAGVVAKGTPTVNTVDTLAAKPGYSAQTDITHDAA